MMNRAGPVATGFLASILAISTVGAEPIAAPTLPAAPPLALPDTSSLGQSGSLFSGACGILNETYSGPCGRLTQGIGNEVSGGGIAYGSWRMHRGLGGINSNLITDTELIRKLSPIVGNDMTPARIKSLAPLARRLSALPAIKHAPKVGILFGAGIIAYEYLIGTDAPEQVSIGDSVPDTSLDIVERSLLSPTPPLFEPLPTDDAGSLFGNNASGSRRLLMESLSSGSASTLPEIAPPDSALGLLPQPSPQSEPD